MTDADRIAALEDRIGRLERVLGDVVRRDADRSRVAMDIVEAMRSRPGYTRDTEAPFSADEIARMTGGRGQE